MHSADYVICDKFGNEKHIKTVIPSHLRGLKIIQRTHAENDTAVAAASILARDEYVRRLDALSAKFSITLPPGASQKVIDVGKEFVSKHGSDKLGQVANLHFKTTQAILNLCKSRFAPVCTVKWCGDFFLVLIFQNLASMQHFNQ